MWCKVDSTILPKSKDMIDKFSLQFQLERRYDTKPSIQKMMQHWEYLPIEIYMKDPRQISYYLHGHIIFEICVTVT